MITHFQTTDLSIKRDGDFALTITLSVKPTFALG